MRHVELRPPAQALQLEREVDEPLATLIALFHVGVPVRSADVREVAPDLDLDGLEALELIRRDDGQVAAVVKVDELEGLFLLADRDYSRPDYVMSMSPSTMLTAAYAPRVAVESALDVGTGSGVQALLAARHAGRVVATDVNRRALWMTNVNAALNGIDNVETREGSFFEPVAGERFGLVITNPPYIISPDTRFLYRDAGQGRDSLCRRIAVDLPGHLEDGGFGVLQCNWVHAGGERWSAPIAESLTGSGCDAWLLRVLTETAARYASRWPEPQYAGDPAGYDEEVRRWLRHYEDEGIEEITLAMVLLRRRSGGTPSWRRAATIRDVPDELLGEHIARVFGAIDRVAELDDHGLLASSLRAVEGLEVVRRRRPGEDERCWVSCPAAMVARRPVGAELASLVERLDGARVLREAMPPEGAPPLDDVRALVKLGFLAFA